MEKNINILLRAKNCSDEIRPVLQDVLKGLKSNRRHIEQGFDIHILPYEIEHITLTDSDSQAKHDAVKKGDTKGSEKETQQPKPGGNTQETPKPKCIGIFERFGLWLNLPVSVILKNIFKK
jgi:hypothetical protein